MSKLRSPYTGPALLTLLSAFTVAVEDGAIRWVWSEAPVVPAILLAFSAFFWVMVVRDSNVVSIDD